MYKVTFSIPEGTQMAGHPAPLEMAMVLRTDSREKAQAKGEKMAKTIAGGLYPKNTPISISVSEVN